MFFRTQYGTKCNFNYVDPKTNETWDKCRVWSEEGIAFNVHQCIDEKGRTATCHNNCKGVDPSAIIGAGVAAVVASGISGQAALPVAGALGLGGLGAVGGGAALMEMVQRTRCPPTQCLVSCSKRGSVTHV